MTGNLAHSLRLAAALADRVGMTGFQSACVEVVTASVAERPDLAETPLAAPIGTPEIALARLSAGRSLSRCRETLTIASKALRALPDAEVLRAITQSVRSATEIPRQAWLNPRAVAEATLSGAVGRLAAQPDLLTTPVATPFAPSHDDATPGYP